MRNYKLVRLVRSFRSNAYVLIPVIFLMIFLNSCKKDTANPGISGLNPDSVKLNIASAQEMGALTMPNQLAGRDGGQSALVGNEVRWIFGDSFFKIRSVDNQQYRTNTSTKSTLANPLNTTEPLDANGVSNQFIRYTPAEKHFNDSANDPGNRIALWPTGIISTGGNNALVFYTKLRIASTWQDYGIGIAHYTAGQDSAVRNPDLLFHTPELNYETPFVHDGYIYITGQNINGVKICRALLSEAEKRSAYQFWNGNSWVSDITAAASIGEYGDGTITYNAFFKMFIRIYSGFGSNTVYISFANNPQGPWSMRHTLYETVPPASGYNYIIFNHTELGSSDGKTIVLSYSHPLPAFLAGEIRLVKITFQ
jgi:hypothetical protein